MLISVNSSDQTVRPHDAGVSAPDIEALTESIGDGYKIHGDFLSAEVNGDGEDSNDRSFQSEHTSDSASILDRPVHSIQETAHILGLPLDLVQTWLDGDIKTRTLPVLRPKRTGSKVVSWGEFVGIALLREYREWKNRFNRLTLVLNALRSDWITPYPLALSRCYDSDKETVIRYQEAFLLPAGSSIIVHVGDHPRKHKDTSNLVLSTEARRFVRNVSFGSDGEVRQFHPAGPASPVVIDPMVCLGRASVEGVATERLWELHDVGESFVEIANGYELDVDLVKAAVSYEELHRFLTTHLPAF